LDDVTAEGDSLADLRAGRTEAIAALYRKESAALLRLLSGMLGGRADAEDALHDLFVGLPDAVQRYDGRGDFTSWLRKVAVRIALMRLRSRRRQGHAPLDAASVVIAGESTDARAMASDTRAAVQRLDEHLRVVFVLYHVEGFSHPEIAALLGISPLNSRVRLARAVARLRKALAP